jgi:opacity protein-like surface antigen
VGLDLGVKYLEANYTLGNDTAGSAPSLRDDLDKGVSAGLTYAFTKEVSASVAYSYDKGSNNLAGLPATLFPAYRDFTHSLVTFGLQYKF